MDNTHRKIIELIVLYMENKISKTQQEELTAWLEKDKKNRSFFQQVISPEKRMQKFETRKHIDSERAFSKFKKNTQPHKVKSIYRLSQYAAIFLVPVLVGLVYLLVNQEPATREISQSPITHGNNKAILILSQGETIDLSPDHALPALPEGIDLVLQGDKLVYISDSTTEKERQYHELVTPRGGEFKITLPDGTFVHLNSNSKLRFPKNFAPDKREIFLSGEAYFEVSKNTNKPFLVIAEDVQVKVYGTTFNINTLLGNQIQTTLVKGSIGIRVQDSSQEYILKPSQQAIVQKTDGDITIRDVDTTPYTAWTEGIFLFDNERLETILDKLALWYDVELFYQNESVKNVCFTGYLKRYDNIDIILNAIESTVSATFHIKERTIIINKNEYTNR